METIGERISRERKAQGIGRTQLSEMTKIGYSTLSELERGGMKTSTKLHIIAAALGVSVSWLETGKGDKRPTHLTLVSSRETADSYRVAQLDAEADMGEGVINSDYPDVVREIDYDITYIRALLGFVPKPGRLKLVTGRGDSMAPTILPGDVVLVDTGCEAFDGDGLYLINTGHGQQIKRLQDRGTALYVVSDNTLYTAFPAPESTTIGGKIYLRTRMERMG